MPNYIMVDYVDVGHVFQVVDMLNRVKGPPLPPSRPLASAHLPHYSPRAVRAAVSGERTEGWMPIRLPEQTYFSFR